MFQWFLISFFLNFMCVNVAEPDVKLEVSSKTVIDCNLAILGSGFAGSYAAFKLSTVYNGSICIIEKLDRDGGRIWDIPEYPGGPVFGAGALRITGNQKTMMALAEELKIKLQKAEMENDLFKVRGRYFYQAQSMNISEFELMCETAFYNLTCNYNGKSTDEAMIERVLETYAASPQLAYHYPDMTTFILSVLGDEGFDFLRQSFAYNSIFSSISAPAILEFFTHGLTTSSFRYYPLGGMSEFIKRMLLTSFLYSVKIYRNEPVVEINSDLCDADSKFYIETPNYMFRAKNVLNSIDPINFLNIKGNIGNLITSSPEFQALKPIPVAVVTVWWSNRWWEESKFYKKVPLGRVVSHQNCFNVMLIPTFPYGKNQNVTRSVYDDASCVDTWRVLVNSNNTEFLAKEVVNSLQNFFSDVTVPTPKHLHGFVHENGWYFQRAESKFTNEEIFEWSQHPVSNKSFAFIGEAYNQNFAGWCDGALKSTMTVLAKYYNLTFPCLSDHGSPAKCPFWLKSDAEIEKRFL